MSFLDIFNRVPTEGNDFLRGRSGADYIHALGGNDRVFGNDGNDTLFGGAGNDSVNGGNGHDLLFGNEGVDTLVGASGSDTLFGGAGDDVMYGDYEVSLPGLAGSLISGNDLMDGGDGRDVMFGGYGNDTLIGGMGKDTMVGGEGADTFHFTSTRESTVIPDFTAEGLASGPDRIIDFKHGVDKIDVSAIDANVTLAGDQAFQQASPYGYTGAGQYAVTYDASRQVTSVAFNTDADVSTSEMTIELSGHVQVTAQDFML